jgi:2-dehydro-3-deoxygluconokinase
VCTALADNEVGRLVEDLILQGGVDTRWLKWVPYDGMGRAVRNGLNFVERGLGVRSALGVSDRGHSATGQLKPGDFDWDQIFGGAGVRWFHTGGIFTALGERTGEVALEAVEAARRRGAIVSFDLNYRASLWNALPDQEKVRALNREIVSKADALFGDTGSSQLCLGVQVEVEARSKIIDPTGSSAFAPFCQTLSARFPSLKAIAATSRDVHSASRNDLRGLLWLEGQTFTSRLWSDLQVLDRIGSGDAFAAGVIYGLMEKSDPQLAVEYGSAHAALSMTTPGDNSMASREEVEALAAGGDARVRR